MNNNEEIKDEICCVESDKKPLDQKFWDGYYQTNQTGWDLGKASPPLVSLIDSLEDKHISILIPGAGNAYEAAYLLQKGFTNVTVVDIAPTVVEKLQQLYATNANIKIVLDDFFNHKGKYDLIIEQTFFCALPPSMRQKYVWKMHQLLSENGVLSGLLFNRTFEVSPPFGGSKSEYEQLFHAAFNFNELKVAENSVAPRAGFELFFKFGRNNAVNVALYNFEGITCSGCVKDVSDRFRAIEGVQNVSINSGFNEVLIVSEQEVPLHVLQEAIAYDTKYKIRKN
jgi:SAM-dependent methyltransferase